MNKAELVSKMAEKSGLTKKEAEAALNAFMSSVQDALVNNEKVQLVGFGTFETREELLDKEEIQEIQSKL
ncbi:DNA-binding protein HU [Clostridioides difficile P32]|nr:DNA-binding protein HU [Clostridioides difficile P32]